MIMDFERGHSVPRLSSECGVTQEKKKFTVRTYFPLNFLENTRSFSMICNNNKYVYQKMVHK